METKFSALEKSLRKNPKKFEKFLLDPVPVLQKAGIPIVREWYGGAAVPEDIHRFPAIMEAVSNPPALTPSTLGAESEHIDVEWNWWGIKIITNEKLTQDIISGVEGTAGLGGLLAAALGAAGLVTGGVATVLGAALAAIFALKVAEIKIVDNGNGVYWPITWLQWPPLVTSVAGGVVGVVAVGSIYVHPFRN